MSRQTENPEHPILFATQSTHKVLAALSQGSMVHVRDGHKPPADRIDPDLFNEAFMMHTSTSPQYGIIASLDVGAQMMAGDAGKALMTDVMEEAIIFRRKMTDLKEQIEQGKSVSNKDWWFTAWQPPREVSSQRQVAEDWTLQPGQSWHGFEGLEDEYIMLDPVKVTVLTPGINEDGDMQDRGIPASVVSRFLMSRGVVAEKTGFYSLLFLFTGGITRGKSGTLLAEFFKFKELYERNAGLDEVFPDLIEEHPGQYQAIGLLDLCNKMHAFLKAKSIATTTKNVYAVIPDTVTTPAEAYRQLVGGQVEKVRIKDLVGRIASVMVVPYPPGIPVWMPGERLTTESADIRDYLAIYEDFDNAFPGFETEIHGVSVEREKDGRRAYAIYCVKE